MKPLKGVFYIMIALFCLTIPCHGERPAKESMAVVKPGVGIGDIRLGDNLSDVIKKMKKDPTEVKRVENRDKKSIKYWVSYKEMGISFVFDERKKLIRIAISNPGIVVDQKEIKVTSSLAELQKSYGVGYLRDIDVGKKFKQRVYPGVSFIINKETEKITVIIIEKGN
jgi:hypothetical protein